VIQLPGLFGLPQLDDFGVNFFPIREKLSLADVRIILGLLGQFG